MINFPSLTVAMLSLPFNSVTCDDSQNLRCISATMSGLYRRVKLNVVM
jgi:hypothetical protein